MNGIHTRVYMKSVIKISDTSSSVENVYMKSMIKISCVYEKYDQD